MFDYDDTDLATIDSDATGDGHFGFSDPDPALTVDADGEPTSTEPSDTTV